MTSSTSITSSDDDISLKLHQYLESPWNYKLSQLDNEKFWISFCSLAENKIIMRSTVPIIHLFRQTLQKDILSKTDVWILRLIVGNHPLIALDSLTLILARAKGVVGAISSSLGSDPPANNKPPDQSPSREKTPPIKYPRLANGSPSPPRVNTPTMIEVKSSLVRVKSFLEDSSNQRVAGQHEFFEITDTEPENVARIRDMELTLDILELMKYPLLQANESKLGECISFLTTIIEKPEGKLQRQLMQRLVVRSIGLLGFWLCGTPAKTRKLLLKEYRDSKEKCSGSIARVAYYNQGGAKIVWVKDNLFDSSMISDSSILELAQDRDVPQLKLSGDVNYEHLYREALLKPSFVLALESEIYARLSAGITNEHFLSLALAFAYQLPQDLEPFAAALESWKLNSKKTDEKVEAFLEAVRIVLEVG
jgi:hypothetical protein